jgi:hypothetical protein
MLEQVSTSVKFLAFYTASKQGKTGLTVTVDIYNPSGTQIVTAGSATALGGGLYSYTLSTNNSAEGEYAAIFKTTDSTVDAQHIPSLWVLGRAGVENLDATTSSRLASSGYTAPANSDISAIKAKTDNLPASPAAVSDIPTTAQIATAVEGSLLNEGDGQAVLNALVGAIGNQNLSEVSLVAAIRSDLERTGGKIDSIPTDSAPSAASVASAVWSASTKEITGGVVDTLTNSPDVPTEAEIATAVWGASTKEITGGTVTNLTNAPASVTPADIWDYNDRTLTSASGPTAVEIRQEIDANSSKLDVAISSRLADADYVEPANSDVAAIKAKTDALPSDPADQSLLEAAIAGVTAPSAATVASAVRSELSSELSKVSALNTERLANVATTAIVGNLIAQANS